MTTKAIRLPWVDYLRGFITLLVVAHHSSLAYTTFAFFNEAAYIASTHPIVDVARWRGLDIFEDFNDIFFMSLMFLISGLFVVNGLKKDTKIFIRDRFYRLFIPFVIGVTLLMLIAHYPAYLLAYGKGDIKAYVIDFFTIEAWPVGPPWFIWVLFSFNLIIAVLYPYLKGTIAKLGTMLNSIKNNPVRIVILLYLLTWVLYMPLVLLAGPAKWTGIGPFDFQVSRVLLYFGYFFIGLIIGSLNLNEGIFADGSAFIKRPVAWLISCLIAYTLVKLIEGPLGTLISNHTINAIEARIIYRSFWILSCCLSCIFFLVLFKRLFRQPSAWWQSLSSNAYGIYLVHYIFVLWCQYILLDFKLPAFCKFLITFVVAVVLSRFTTYLVRKIKIVGKYL